MNRPYPLDVLIRSLPRRVRPFPDETVASYLNRLATANRLDTSALRTYLTSDIRKNAPIPAGNLAVVSGQSARTLRYAMPELCEPAELATMQLTRRPQPGKYRLHAPACTHCVRAKGINQTVDRWLRHDNIICRRHRRWTTSTHQPDLADQPDILRAHRQHQLLIRRHGQETVHAAYTEARHICHEWHCFNRHTDHLKQLLRRFFNGDFGRLTLNNPYSQAAAYPQIIALKFVAEIQRTVAPTYRWEPEQWGLRHESLVDRIAHAIHFRDYPDRHNDDPRTPTEAFPRHGEPSEPLHTAARSYVCHRIPSTEASYRYVEHEQPRSDRFVHTPEPDSAGGWPEGWGARTWPRISTASASTTAPSGGDSA